jgi:hypothetical protein
MNSGWNWGGLRVMRDKSGPSSPVRLPRWEVIRKKRKGKVEIVMDPPYLAFDKAEGRKGEWWYSS